MGLVDYSDSDSDSDSVPKPAGAKPVASPPAPASSTTGKKPFQKVVDRSNPGKIRVNLPSLAPEPEASKEDEPPAKRARTGAGGGRFSGFNSFLPAPKNAGKPAVASSSGRPAPRPGINLKTGAAPGFSRDFDDDDDGAMGGGSREGGGQGENGDGGMRLPTPKIQQPTIPEGQKAAEDVKLVGKPLMFKPLSVARKPTKKKAVIASGEAVGATGTKTATAGPAASARGTSAQIQDTLTKLDAPKEAAPKKKISLFSISTEEEEPAAEVDEQPSTGAYEPLFTAPDPASTAEAFAAYDAQQASSYAAADSQQSQAGPTSSSLRDIASSMNLSAAARRELFGRGGAPSAVASAQSVINFNTDAEYAANEELRAAGEQQVYNPVRAIAPGKHSLRQLVNQVHNQREALEESFAKGKSNRDAAGQRYGWR